MPLPVLTPPTTVSRLVLPSTGSHSEVTSTNLPYGVYISSQIPTSEQNLFISGAVSQVAFVYRMLGGSVLDIELTTGDVYSSYELACLEYSSILNMHQAKNSLVNLLGYPTASFNHLGEYLSGTVSSSLSGGNVALKYPKFQFAYEKRLAGAVGTEVRVGGNTEIYSGSINLTSSIQDYDLQTIIEQSSLDTNQLFYGKVNNKKIEVKKVYYKSPRAVWRFYGYYGGLVSIGNLSTYGQFADDHTFQIVPVWQNKAQAAAYEDAINTRISHYSYQIINNKLRLFPIPDDNWTRIWIEFTVSEEPWLDNDGYDSGVDGINNVGTLPFSNISFKNINSMGQHWIRNYSLAICKSILALNRGKFQTLPIPGESATLNHAELAAQAKEEMKNLKDELKKELEELTYSKLAEMRKNESENVQQTLRRIPNFIYVG